MRQNTVDSSTPGFRMLPSEKSIDEEQEIRQSIVRSFEAGYRRIVAWADVIDRINVFPVPDGDTGRNLVLSLSPLNDPNREIEFLSKECCSFF